MAEINLNSTNFLHPILTHLLFLQTISIILFDAFFINFRFSFASTLLLVCSNYF